ncbi:hypothetical protein QMK47_12320 [Pseudomonas sp. P9_35]|uniref:hypothetical protein n=1 Tax=unclassified Pseudomonas TaxID=196821 RepID=UPI002A35F539|nr:MULTISPECIES: hypothetical protein [unclassified Pseudomonas]WPN65732.1 hypothetical protein QMK48_11405 [Pseudomonas sp. P9_32]WPN71482.1 hypothetical protein QMK47_12320 [Pseudomonas sp. P9_35]
MKISLGLVALAGCLSTFAVSAAGSSHSDLFKALAQCQANAQQVGKFNDLVDAEQLTLSKDEAHSPWGGGAWQATPALTVHGVSSTTLVMTDRFSFFLQAKSSSPKADAEKLASTLKLKKTLDTDGYVDYQRSLGNGATLRVVSTEDKASDLYVGCSYEQDAS